MTKEELEQHRQAIDAIDAQLLDLFNQRAEIVLKVARIKKGMGLKLFDPDREEQIFSTVREKNNGPLPNESVVRLFERIIDESRFLEHNRVFKPQSESEQ